MAEEGAIRVTVLYSPGPRRVLEWPVGLQAGADVAQALQASGLPSQAPDLDLGKAVIGLWGRRVGMQQPLRDGDRVEVLRPLQVDPKVARRERFRQQGARAAGLFALRGKGPAKG